MHLLFQLFFFSVLMNLTLLVKMCTKLNIRNQCKMQLIPIKIVLGSFRCSPTGTTYGQQCILKHATISAWNKQLKSYPLMLMLIKMLAIFNGQHTFKYIIIYLFSDIYTMLDFTDMHLSCACLRSPTSQLRSSFLKKITAQLDVARCNLIL